MNRIIRIKQGSVIICCIIMILSSVVIAIGIDDEPRTNQPPVADAGPDQTVNVNNQVFFNGSNSYDSDGSILSYEWDFGDGFTHSSYSNQVVDIIQITNAPYHEVDPEWSPDGQHIAISAWTSQWYHDVITMNSDGSNQQHLTSTPLLHERMPSYSPDGSQIAYSKGTVDTTHGDGDYDIMIMNSDGTNKTQVTSSSFDEKTVTWSPDGSKLYFGSDRDGNYELWSVNPDGSNLAQLTDGLSMVFNPAVSPDGTKIAFSSDATGSYEIMMLDLGSGTISQVTSEPAHHSLHPSWNPDGSLLTYTKAPLNLQTANIWIMTPEGANQQQLTFYTGLNAVPDWSPDGSKILFRSNKDGPYNIHVLTLIGEPTAQHAYTLPGVYTVTLMVTDNDGATDNDTCIITVSGPQNSTATATGPQGAHHDPVITVTYDWTENPIAIDLYYSTNSGDSWNYLATDYSVDGSYDWEPESNPGPKPSKYYWIANAQFGADDVGIPANGTAPEAGPFNWKTWDTCKDAPLPLSEGSSNWFFISVPLDISGDLLTIFDDAAWGDGGTTWDYIQWYDSNDPSDPWNSYSIYRPPTLNDDVNVDNTMGFWIHLTSNDGDGVLTVGEGSEPITTTIYLQAGWNLVGYPSTTEGITMSDALWGTGIDRVDVFDPSSPYRLREIGPNYLMKSGEAYWIHVAADTTWVVDW